MLGGYDIQLLQFCSPTAQPAATVSAHRALEQGFTTIRDMPETEGATTATWASRWQSTKGSHSRPAHLHHDPRYIHHRRLPA